METVREIHGIDQAVCLLMFGLDSAFGHRVAGWKRTRKGFRISVLKQDEADVTLRISPIGVPANDYIVCRFVHDLSFWVPYKGQMSPVHSITELRDLLFNATSTTYGDEGPNWTIDPRYPHKERLMQILSREKCCDCGVA
jgi:hypothetical protein